MSKQCSNCGTENEDNSTFCRNCGKKLQLHPINTEINNQKKNNNEKILIVVIIALLIAIAIIGTYAFTILNNDNSDTGNILIGDVSNSSDSNADVNGKSWHKINTFNGVGDDTITVTSGGNKIKVVSTAMPLKNYAENFMFTTVSKNGYSVGSSELSWGDTSAVAKKTDTIEFQGSGTYYIYISAYELDYWNLEVYEYY